MVLTAPVFREKAGNLRINWDDRGKGVDLMYIHKFREICQIREFQAKSCSFFMSNSDFMVYQSLNATLLYEMIYYRYADDGNQAVRSGPLDIVNNLSPNATKYM